MIEVRREDELHRAVVRLLRHAARGDVIWFHVPNGEHRNTVTGARLKSLGVRPGVADLAFVLPGGRAAFLELKRSRGRLSPAQETFAAECQRSGALHAIASNIDDALERLRGWGVLKLSFTTAGDGEPWGGGGRRRSGVVSQPSTRTTRAPGAPA